MGGGGLSGGNPGEIQTGPNGSIWGGRDGNWNSPGISGSDVSAAQGGAPTTGNLIDQWAAGGDAPSGLTPEILAAIRSGNNRIGAGGHVMASIGGQLTDISGFVNSYKSWEAGQKTASDSFSTYVAAAKGQPGRDANLLTGAVVAPETAIGQVYGLGGPQSNAPVPGSLASLSRGTARRQI